MTISTNRSLVNFIMTLVAGFVVVSFTTACSKKNDQPNVELIQDMMESPAIKPQEGDVNSPNNSGMRVPPEGTQPVGFVPYKYANDIAGAMKNQNPLGSDSSEAIMKVGLKYYSTQCAVCHGEKGEGSAAANSSVGTKMALQPPSLLSDKVRAWTDGQLYHVITVGQGMMGPYASHIPQKYRWQVVNYIRSLQKDNK